MKCTVVITSLLFSIPSLALGAPTCILDIDEVPPRGATQVWSPLFQASWELLQDRHQGKLVKVVPPNPLITQLEKFKWQPKEVMPEDGYAVYAGPATQEFARETAEAIKKRFNVAVDTSRLPINPQGNSVFGILLRELKFKVKFYRSKKKSLEFQSSTGETHKVQFFGTDRPNDGGYGDSVKVLHYDPDSASFSLSIATDKEGEKLIVYRPERQSSFRAAIDHVKKSMKKPLAGAYGSLTNGTLNMKDVVKIPYIVLDADTDFTEQLGGDLHYAGDPLTWRITMAYQITKFELFEDGAIVRVDTGVSGNGFGIEPEITPRNFICDRPFYIFIWKESADWPYLATWIDGADCLIPFAE